MEKHLDFIKNTTQLEDFKILPLAGDASSRSYYRVVDGNQSYILMSWEPFKPEDYPFIQVTELFKNHGVNVPEIISVRGDDGLMLLEDLGDLTLERKFWEFQDDSLATPYYENALNELIKIQFNTQKESLKTSCAFTTKFDAAKFMWEFNYTLKYLIQGILKFEMPAELKQAVTDDFNNIASTLASHSTHVAHRDYHSRNLMIKLGEIKVIDYQDARLGPLQYDLVSLIHDSYVNLSPKNKLHLINFYKNKIKGLYANFHSDEFDQIFKIQTIQRCFKACGSFASFYCTRNDTRYLKYIEKTIQIVSEELTELNEYNSMLKLLSESNALNFKYEKL